MNEKDLLKYLKDHSEDYLFKALQNGKQETSGLYSALKKDLEENKKQIDEIYYHTKVMNEELGETRDEQRKVRADLNLWQLQNATEHSEIKTDVNWIKRVQWFLLTTSISTLIGIIFLLVKLVLEK